MDDGMTGERKFVISKRMFVFICVALVAGIYLSLIIKALVTGHL